MFYDSNEVDNELSCKHCEGRLLEPKFIPCGETICSLCEKSIQVNDQMFDCLVCQLKHEMPKDGLLKNKLALPDKSVATHFYLAEIKLKTYCLYVSFRLIKNGI